MLGLLFITGFIINDIKVDKIAHFGVAYSATHASYQICSLQIPQKDRIHCAIVSSALVLFASVAWEHFGHFESLDLAADIVGIGASNALIHVEWFFN